MPTLDSDSLYLRPGVHLYERLDDPKTLLGGRYLHGNVLLKESELSFIAVRQGGALWYGQLVMCFSALYLGETVELLYVRWFDTVRASRHVPSTVHSLRRSCADHSRPIGFLSSRAATFMATHQQGLHTSDWSMSAASYMLCLWCAPWRTHLMQPTHCIV